MQSQRPLYARAMRGRACIHGYARVVRFFSSFLFFFCHFSSFCALVLRETHTRAGTHVQRARAPSRSALAHAALLARTVYTTDAEKARIKLSRWYAVCIAWRRRVMRAGVRIYGRHGCSRNADRWNVKVLLPFFPAGYARGKKFNVFLAERDECSFSSRRG